MKKFLLVVLAIPSLAFASHCDLPNGQIDYLDARLNHFEVPGTGAPSPYKNVVFSTQIEASSDCSSVRVWQTMTAPGETIKKPTAQQCDSIQGGDYSSIPGLASCTTYKVYKSEKDAIGKPLPYAYMDHGALVTRAYAGLLGGLSSSVYLENAGSKRVVGMNQMLFANQVKNQALYDPEFKAMQGKVYIDNSAGATNSSAPAVSAASVPR